MGADFESTSAPCAFDELNACDHLFVNEISEPHENTLRLLFAFGMPALLTEVYEGKLARRHSISKLLQLVLETTHATDEYPGKLLHLQIICEMHVIDVISVESPLCFKSGPTSKLQ